MKHLKTHFEAYLAALVVCVAVGLIAWPKVAWAVPQDPLVQIEDTSTTADTKVLSSDVTVTHTGDANFSVWITEGQTDAAVEAWITNAAGTTHKLQLLSELGATLTNGNLYTGTFGVQKGWKLNMATSANTELNALILLDKD